MFTTRLDAELWADEFRSEGFQAWSCVYMDHEPWVQVSVKPVIDDPRPKGIMMPVSEFAALCAGGPSSLKRFSSVDLTISPEMSELDGWKIYKLLELTEWVSEDGVFHWFECKTDGGVYQVGQPGELMISSPRSTLPPKVLYALI